MSEDNRPDQVALTDLPSPRSPKALDSRIRHYAREKAPARKPGSLTGWVSGLAMASVVGLALLVALPTEPPPPSVSETFQPAAPAMETSAHDAVPVTIQRAGRQTRIDVAQRLEELSTLIDQGEMQAATDGYSMLRRQCPGCALPASLQQALKQALDQRDRDTQQTIQAADSPQ